MVCEYSYDPNTRKMRVDCLGCIYGASIEDSPECMSRTIEKLMEVGRTTGVILAETREYEYDEKNTALLLEIAQAVIKIVKTEKLTAVKNLGITECEKCVPRRFSKMQDIVSTLKSDPIDAYKMLLREIRHVNMNIKKTQNPLCIKCYNHYLNRALIPMKNIIEPLRLIQLSADKIKKAGDRSIYREIFHPTIRPNFMFTRFISLPPANAEPLDRYTVGDGNSVQIVKIPGKVRLLYHISPSEFNLTEDEYMLLDSARNYLSEHKPKEAELTDPERIRERFYNINFDLLNELAERYGKTIPAKRLSKLASILTRYTAGFGVLELLLQDEKIQDISINSPVSQSPIYIFHSDFGECETNLVVSPKDAESWATRFRLMSGRPLDEANPVLDTELIVPGGRARVAAITRSLSPEGLGFALRRHREKPWTFPLFIKNKMLNPLGAGLIWFIIDGARTFLVAGTRSSGKTSFLGSMMLQIMPSTRIITVEDTLELPVVALKKLGYDIERLKSRSVITQVKTELPAEEALRTSLRLGDSSLIIGEVRSREALALYEAMRIGALANVVAGTIHGDSPYGVFDRVVNDLGVPATSFKATDIIIIANRLKTPDGLHSFRRITEITELRKHWTDTPEKGGFEPLMQYSAKDDELKPTPTLLTGESTILNNISQNIREWRGNWDAIWSNINLRAKILNLIVESAKKTNDDSLLEAPFVMQSNNIYHLLCDEVRKEVGSLDSDMIYDKYVAWIKEQIRKKEL